MKENIANLVTSRKIKTRLARPIDSDNDVANHIPHTTYKTQDTDSEDELPLIHFLPKATTADNLSNATPLTVESTNHTISPNTPNKPLPLSVDADHMSKRKASCFSSSDNIPLAQLKKRPRTVTPAQSPVSMSYRDTNQSDNTSSSSYSDARDTVNNANQHDIMSIKKLALLKEILSSL